jgi:hypothetical protein
MAGKNKKNKKSKNKQHGEKNTETLASQLCRQRGTADSTPLPPSWPHPENKTFLTPNDDDAKLFHDC